MEISQKLHQGLITRILLPCIDNVQDKKMQSSPPPRAKMKIISSVGLSRITDNSNNVCATRLPPPSIVRQQSKSATYSS